MSAISDRQRFESDPVRYLRDELRDYTASAPGNRLKVFDNAPIFDEPLLGIASGDDSLFEQFRTAVGSFHQTPRQAMLKRFGDTANGNLSVIAFVLPFTLETRVSMRRETKVPSLRWNHARVYGQEFIDELARHLIKALAGFGYRAVAPALESDFEVRETPTGRASTWSHRHMAYAAGLGTFSLSDSFITSRGTAMRCGSVVTDAPLLPNPRPYSNHLANCLFYVDGSCRACIERCPAGAISERGHDHIKCREYTRGEQKRLVDALGDSRFAGQFPGCGHCQTKVPCEGRIPRASGAR